MLKNLFFTLALIVTSLVFVSSGTDLFAQSCSGSYTSSGLWKCVENLPGLYDCELTGSYNSGCSWNVTAGDCAADVYVPENCVNSGTPNCAVYNKYDGYNTAACTTTWCNNNGTCEPGIGETPANCPSDCVVSPPPTCNNNGICDAGEDNGSCPGDCPVSNPGWGSCGSCSTCGGPTSECVKAPDNSCLWDVAKCGSAPPSAPYCNMSFQNLGAIQVAVGETTQVGLKLKVYNSRTDWNNCPGVWPSGDNIKPIVSTNTSVFTVNPGQFCSIPNNWQYDLTRNVSITGQSVGNAIVSATAEVNGDGGSGNCYASKNVVVTLPKPWFQVKGGGNTMVGSKTKPNEKVESKIPNTCTLPTCDPNFIIDDPDSGTPGVAVSSGASTYSTPSGSGKANSKDWKVETSYSGDAVDTQFYFNVAESKVVYDMNANGETELTAGTPTDVIDKATANWVDESDVAWVKKQGDLDIRNLVDNGHKTVVLVECGDLNIGQSPGNGRLRINSPDSTFIMIVVGKCGAVGGNVNIDPDVEEVDGIIIADGDVTVETKADCTVVGPNNDDKPIEFEGSIVANGSINLNRDFCAKDNPGDDGNEDSPTETFINMPVWDVDFPSSLTDKHLYWREIVP